MLAKLLLVICLLTASNTWSISQFLGLETNDDECTVCCSKLSSRPQQNYTYYQDTGRFVGGSGEWAIDTHGYSGSPAGRNDPTKQCIVSTGPAPAGQYNLSGCKDTMHNETVIRPCSFWMTPLDESKMCGRSGIMLHGCQCCTDGDTTEPPIDGCSEGCVVIRRAERMKVRVGDIITVEHYEPKKNITQ